MSPIDIQKILPHRSINAIKLRGQKLGLSMYSDSKFHNKWKIWEIEYLKDNWTSMSDVLMSKKLNRTQRAVKAKRNELNLFRQEPDRELTYYDLNKFLRGNILEWKKKSIKACNNKCILTGSENYDIHHLFNFQHILEKYIDEYSIKIYQDINNYTKHELEYIVNTFNEFHNKYPLGVCVDKDIHKMFHHYYGKSFNTPAQWNEFCDSYKKGKYNH